MCTTGCCGNGCRAPYVLPQGPKGDAGVAGPQGPQGIQGNQGQTGADGTPGSNANQAVAKFARGFTIISQGGQSIGTYTISAAELAAADMPFTEINVDANLNVSNVVPTDPSYSITLYKRFGAAGNWIKVGTTTRGATVDINEGLAYITFNPAGDLSITAQVETYKVVIIG